MTGRDGKLPPPDAMTQWMDHIPVVATGLCTVLGVLVALWAACALIGVPFVRRGARALPAASGRPRDGIPPEHVVAVAGAVAAVMDGPHRIVHISAPSHRPPGWSLRGRFDSFGAHRIPWDRWPRVATKGSRRKSR